MSKFILFSAYSPTILGNHHMGLLQPFGVQHNHMAFHKFAFLTDLKVIINILD